MRRNPRHFSRLAAAVLVTGSLLALGIWFGPRIPGPLPFRGELLDLTAAPAQPAPAFPRTPAEALAAAVAGVMRERPQAVSLLFPDADVAGRFYTRWQGKLPKDGTVLVAQADQVNAGAEHGHLVPVAVWVAGEREVAGLKGEAEFVSGPRGVQMMRIDLEPVPLQVATWADAARLVAARRPGAGPVKPAGAPFYGRFWFVAGNARYAVDAVTGLVEDE